MQTAVAGDTVWVAQGLYRTTSGTDRTIHFHLKSGVKLYGGFAGDETELAQRDWAAHPTIFDGDIGLADDSTDNTYNLLYLDNPDSNTLIDGFIFRYAIANNINSTGFDPTVCGAAIFIDAVVGEAYPLIRNCTFIDNFAINNGGAVYVHTNLNSSVAPRFWNCVFRSNYSLGWGGAVYRGGSSWVEWPGDFRDCLFQDNYAVFGGAIFYNDAPRTDTLQVERCQFINNVAYNFGGAFYTNGRPEGCLIVMRNCDFVENQARIGGGISHYSDSSPIGVFSMDSCLFLQNKIYQPIQGIPAYAPAMSIYSGFFAENEGLILIHACHILEQKNSGGDEVIGFFNEINIQNCSFNTNSIQFSAGNKMWFRQNTCKLKDQVIYISSSQNERNVVVWDNLFLGGAPWISGPAIYSGNLFKDITFSVNPPQPNGGGYPVPSLVFNNIFYNTQNIHPGANGYFVPINYDSTYFYNNLISDLPDCEGFPSLFVCGPGNLFGLDPLFADTAAGDFHLLPCSPAINAGLNDFYLQNNLLNDLDGNPRILDGLTDMGPYESPLLAAAAPPAVRPACPGTASGAVLFDIDNACSPLAFLWSGDNGAGSDTSALAPGMYQFTITDQQGKVLQLALAVGEANPPLLSAETTPASCPGCPDGAITASAEGGYPPFSFLWSTGDTGVSIAGVPPGLYDISVTDAAGCVYTDSITLLAVGTDEASQPGFRLFPNPAHDATLLQLAAPAPAELRLCLTDANGRTLRHWILPAGADRLPLPLDGLSSGVYWLWLRDDERVQGVRLLRR